MFVWRIFVWTIELNKRCPNKIKGVLIQVSWISKHSRFHTRGLSFMFYKTRILPVLAYVLKIFPYPVNYLFLFLTHYFHLYNNFQGYFYSPSYFTFEDYILVFHRRNSCMGLSSSIIHVPFLIYVWGIIFFSK